MTDEFSPLKLMNCYVYFTVVQPMLNLLYFVVTVLAFIVYFYGFIGLELLLTMSIVAFKATPKE